MFILEKANPLPESVICFPVSFNASCICNGVNVIFCSSLLVCLNNAKAAATCGVAIEVPLSEMNPPPKFVEFIEEPGARSIGNAHKSENDEIESLFVVEPTTVTFEIQAGVLTPSGELSSLPAATVTDMFLLIALWIELTRRGLSLVSQ